MPSPIPATAYPAPTPAYRSSNRDLFGQGASGQDMAVLAAAPGSVETVLAPEAPQAPKDGHPLFGKDGFTFSDFLDIINPLQHIPVVSSIYRAVTGDQIDPGARLAGGGLFGGPIGLVVSMVSGMVEEATGKDPGEHALAALGFDVRPNAVQASETLVAEQDAPAIDPSTLAAAQVQAQASQPDPQMKLGVKMDDGSQSGTQLGRRKLRDDKPAEEAAAKTDGPIELPADLFQALKQTAAAQEADARNTTINAASSNPAAMMPQPVQARGAAGPMQTNAMPNTAIQAADGRAWFPARSVAVPAPTRGVGTQAVTQQTVQSRYGVTRGGAGVPSTAQSATAAAASMIQQSVDPQQAEWASKASDAYQKYFEMQNERNRRAGIVQ
jgi:hypothetical protein